MISGQLMDALMSQIYRYSYTLKRIPANYRIYAHNTLMWLPRGHSYILCCKKIIIFFQRSLLYNFLVIFRNKLTP